MSWLLTYSGKHFDLIDPQPDMIDVEDIVRGLSREARFAGQTRYFYSVAQHSVLASQLVDPEYAMEALMHDASEAYIKDIPRPLKQLLPEYRMIEARVQGAICDRFGLPPLQSAAVTEADIIMLATERRDLMPDDATDWPVLNGVRPMEKRLSAVNYNHALEMFMMRFIRLLQS